MKACIATALLLVCGICFAQANPGGKPRNSGPYPTEGQLRTAAENAGQILRAEGLDLEVIEAQKVGLDRPLLASRLSRDGGVCLIFYNKKPEDGLTQFFATVAASDLPLLLDAIAMHEATHCIEQREAYVRNRFEKILPPGSGRDSATVQGYTRAVESGALETWGEALADIVSLLYLQQVAPGRWKDLANGIAGMRRKLAGKWPAHDTSPWLYKIIAADAGAIDANQNLFETAFQLRRKYRPTGD